MEMPHEDCSDQNDRLTNLVMAEHERLGCMTPAELADALTALGYRWQISRGQPKGPRWERLTCPTCGARMKGEPVARPGGMGEVARALGVSEASVWRWLHGRGSVPKWVGLALEDLARHRLAAALTQKALEGGQDGAGLDSPENPPEGV